MPLEVNYTITPTPIQSNIYQSWDQSNSAASSMGTTPLEAVISANNNGTHYVTIDCFSVSGTNVSTTTGENVFTSSFSSEYQNGFKDWQPSDFSNFIEGVTFPMGVLRVQLINQTSPDSNENFPIGNTVLMRVWLDGSFQIPGNDIVFIVDLDGDAIPHYGSASASGAVSGITFNLVSTNDLGVISPGGDVLPVGSNSTDYSNLPINTELIPNVDYTPLLDPVQPNYSGAGAINQILVNIEDEILSSNFGSTMYGKMVWPGLSLFNSGSGYSTNANNGVLNYETDQNRWSKKVIWRLTPKDGYTISRHNLKISVQSDKFSSFHAAKCWEGHAPPVGGYSAWWQGFSGWSLDLDADNPGATQSDLTGVGDRNDWVQVEQDWDGDGVTKHTWCPRHHFPESPSFPNGHSVVFTPNNKFITSGPEGVNTLLTAGGTQNSDTFINTPSGTVYGQDAQSINAEGPYCGPGPFYRDAWTHPQVLENTISCLGDHLGMCAGIARNNLAQSLIGDTAEASSLGILNNVNANQSVINSSPLYEGLPNNINTGGGNPTTVLGGGPNVPPGNYHTNTGYVNCPNPQLNPHVTWDCEGDGFSNWTALTLLFNNPDFASVVGTDDLDWLLLNSNNQGLTSSWDEINNQIDFIEWGMCNSQIVMPSFEDGDAPSPGTIIHESVTNLFQWGSTSISSDPDQSGVVFIDWQTTPINSSDITGTPGTFGQINPWTFVGNADASFANTAFENVVDSGNWTEWASNLGWIDADWLIQVENAGGTCSESLIYQNQDPLNITSDQSLANLVPSWETCHRRVSLYRMPQLYIQSDYPETYDFKKAVYGTTAKDQATGGMLINSWYDLTPFPTPEWLVSQIEGGAFNIPQVQWGDDGVALTGSQNTMWPDTTTYSGQWVTNPLYSNLLNSPNYSGYNPYNEIVWDSFGVNSPQGNILNPDDWFTSDIAENIQGQLGGNNFYYNTFETQSPLYYPTNGLLNGEIEPRVWGTRVSIDEPTPTNMSINKQKSWGIGAGHPVGAGVGYPFAVRIIDEKMNLPTWNDIESGLAGQVPPGQSPNILNSTTVSPEDWIGNSVLIEVWGLGNLTVPGTQGGLADLNIYIPIEGEPMPLNGGEGSIGFDISIEGE